MFAWEFDVRKLKHGQIVSKAFQVNTTFSWNPENIELVEGLTDHNLQLTDVSNCIVDYSLSGKSLRFANCWSRLMNSFQCRRWTSSIEMGATLTTFVSFREESAYCLCLST